MLRSDWSGFGIGNECCFRKNAIPRTLLTFYRLLNIVKLYPVFFFSSQVLKNSDFPSIFKVSKRTIFSVFPNFFN